VSLPVALALKGAWTLSLRAVNQKKSEIERLRTQDVRNQVRSLSDEIWNGIEAVKIRVQASAVSLKAPESAGIESVVTLTGDLKFSKILWGPEQLTPEMLRVVARSISMRDIQSTGVSLIPIALKTRQGTNSLGIVFENRPNESYWMAIVDPAETFAGVSRWATGREGEMLRGFLIAPNGRVLVHSEKIYNGADFSDLTLFRQALIGASRGERAAGVGIFRAADTLKARVGYAQLHSLPYVVVAERVIRANTMGLVKELLGPALVILAILVFATLGSIVLILRAFGQVTRPVTEQKQPRKQIVLKVPELERQMKELAELQELKAEKQHARDQLMKAARATPGAPQKSFDEELKEVEKRGAEKPAGHLDSPHQPVPNQPMPNQTIKDQ
jgi:hypothetical protein